MNRVLSLGVVWPAANRAIYIPFTINKIVTARKIGVRVTTQSGNLDVGLYDVNAVRLISSGSTAVGAANSNQSIDITDTVLTPGTYFAAMCVDNTTAAFATPTPAMETQLLQVCGVQQQAVGAVTLPNPATFANPASAYIPYLTVALGSVF
jgi:hypothetical protein